MLDFPEIMIIYDNFFNYVLTIFEYYAMIICVKYNLLFLKFKIAEGNILRKATDIYMDKPLDRISSKLIRKICRNQYLN